MTREEAIKGLKVLRKDFSGYKPNEEMFDMAIKALEQESIVDKIKAEIDRQEKWLMCAGCNAYNVDIAFNSIKSVLSESEE